MVCRLIKIKYISWYIFSLLYFNFMTNCKKNGNGWYHKQQEKLIKNVYPGLLYAQQFSALKGHNKIW